MTPRDTPFLRDACSCLAKAQALRPNVVAHSAVLKAGHVDQLAVLVATLLCCARHVESAVPFLEGYSGE